MFLPVIVQETGGSTVPTLGATDESAITHVLTVIQLSAPPIPDSK